jgi:hypothetical protein
MLLTIAVHQLCSACILVKDAAQDPVGLDVEDQKNLRASVTFRPSRSFSTRPRVVSCG